MNKNCDPEALVKSGKSDVKENDQSKDAGGRYRRQLAGAALSGATRGQTPPKNGEDFLKLDDTAGWNQASKTRHSLNMTMKL